jgi:hypothetical protein
MRRIGARSAHTLVKFLVNRCIFLTVTTALICRRLALYIYAILGPLAQHQPRHALMAGPSALP